MANVGGYLPLISCWVTPVTKAMRCSRLASASGLTRAA
jgi:hypothetical protein